MISSGNKASLRDPRNGQPAASSDGLVVGSTQLFEGGLLRYIPAPTSDPRDPLNLPEWRKWLAIGSLCFFGALALAIEHIVGSLLPVFVLEYAGLDPKVLLLDNNNIHNNSSSRSSSGGVHSGNGDVNLDGLSALSAVDGLPIARIALLSTLPMFVNGIASFLLVPLSIAVGRRPVVLLCGLMAWVGGLWAGFSTSFGSHLTARCFQGFGAGVVDTLIPLIIQDIMFIHQRNGANAGLNASQGLIIVSLGIASPFVVTRLSWRYLYWVFSGAAALAWITVFFCVPETRRVRSQDELAGKQTYTLGPGESYPRLDFARYGRRTWRTDFSICTTPMEWKLALRALWHTVNSLAFPNILWTVAVSSALLAATGATFQTCTAVLIAAGWRFETVGLHSLAVVAACPLVWFFGGYLADKASNYMARRKRTPGGGGGRGGGCREAEAHLVNIVSPVAAAVAGVLVYGYAAANIAHVSSFVLLAGLFLLCFGSGTCNTVLSVYIVESYPNFAGPVLVIFSSLRLMVGFGFTFKATAWIKALGFMAVFSIYAVAIFAVSAVGILIYIYGKGIRAWASRSLTLDFMTGRDGDDGTNSHNINWPALPVADVASSGSLPSEQKSEA
ncbi:major facilitator superfamily transporter [Xylariales sp. PMI_506]|nr:major facilitator superfamily transporter [Xylariales sp. PMI_506]